MEQFIGCDAHKKFSVCGCTARKRSGRRGAPEPKNSLIFAALSGKEFAGCDNSFLMIEFSPNKEISPG